MTPNPLVGTWKLISYEIRLENGQGSYPWGQNPVGYIIYTEEGYMSVSMMSANRPPLSSNDITKVSKKELLALADTWGAYSGTYEILTDKVVHHVEVHRLPNQVGMNLERTFKITGNRLLLSSTPPVKEDNQHVFSYFITWERI